jgi:hypothetical protein
VKPGLIDGYTRALGAPVDWDAHKHGVCGMLPIRDEMSADGLRRMVSAWTPTWEEAAAIVAGAPVQLTIVGTSHPVVSLGVGAVPRAE